MIKRIKPVPLLLGNSLEFYDITIYALFQHTFTEYYFQPLSVNYASYFSWMAFVITYLARPIGAVLFGYIGDKFSRIKSLKFSIFGMASSTFLIGVLPDYQIMGFWAPVILMLLRFIQGISMAGECNGIAVYLLENTEGTNQYKIGALIMASTFLGASLGCIAALLVSLNISTIMLWRVCFILGSVIALIGFYLRNSQDIVTPKHNKIFREIWQNKLNFLVILFTAGLNGSVGYALLGFLASYLKSKGLFSQNIIIVVVLLGILSAIISCLLIHSEKYTKTMSTENLTIYSTIKALPICFVSMVLLESNSLFILVGASIVLGYSVGLLGRYMHCYISFLMPSTCRYTGTSLAFGSGMALFGGTAPIVYSILLDSGFPLGLMPFYPSVIFIILTIILYLKNSTTFK